MWSQDGADLPLCLCVVPGVLESPDPSFEAACDYVAPWPATQVMYNSWKMYLPRKRWRNRGYGFVAFKKLEDAVAARTSLLGARVEVLVRDMNRGLVVQYFNTPEGADATNLDGF